MNLRHLTDKVLLADTKRLAGREREITLQILHHLKEIERRRLYSELGFSSLFEYAVKELGYSDASAARRIRSARLIAELPQIEKKVETGSLNLTNIAMAANLFRNEDIKDKDQKLVILKEIEKTTKKECEAILLGYSSPTPPPKEIIKQTTPEFHTIKINLSNETMKLFQELKDLLGHHRFNNDQLFKSIFKTASEQIKNKKFHLNTKLTALAPSPGVNKRYISAAVKKAVFERDKGKCRKCGGTKLIQYDHIIPFSQGGTTTSENLRLLCFGCNQRSGIAGRIINKAQ